jgi:hypothetical protein
LQLEEQRKLAEETRRTAEQSSMQTPGGGSAGIIYWEKNMKENFPFEPH